MIRDPIAKLMEDHQVFLRTSESFHSFLGGDLRHGTAAEVLPRRVAEFARFLAIDVDQIHGRQEERGLFPALERYLPVEGGPTGVLLGEHEALRGFHRALEGEAGKLESDPEAEEAIVAVRSVSGDVGQLLAAPIAKEDSVLFPMAYQLLTAMELEEIGRIFEEVAASVDGSKGPGSPSAPRTPGEARRLLEREND